MTGRTRSSFDSSFSTQLAGYSLVASAVVALSPTGAADIIYSGPLNQTFTPGSPANLDLDGNGTDIQFSAIQAVFGSGSRSVGVGASGRTSPAGYWSLNFYPQTLGYPINSSVYNWRSGGPLALGFQYSTGSTNQYGPFAFGQRGYIPVRLDTGNGDFHYGWIDFEANSFPDGGTIHGWAWESDPNVSITAGAVPEPAESAVALGLLALGAAGVRRYKRARALAA